MDDLLREANVGMDALYAYWLEYYGEHTFPPPLMPERLGLPSDHFLLIELSNQRAYAV